MYRAEDANSLATIPVQKKLFRVLLTSVDPSDANFKSANCAKGSVNVRLHSVNVYSNLYRNSTNNQSYKSQLAVVSVREYKES